LHPEGDDAGGDRIQGRVVGGGDAAIRHDISHELASNDFGDDDALVVDRALSRTPAPRRGRRERDRQGGHDAGVQPAPDGAAFGCAVDDDVLTRGIADH
jgi:hypothetical protein